MKKIKIIILATIFMINVFGLILLSSYAHFTQQIESNAEANVQGTVNKRGYFLSSGGGDITMNIDLNQYQTSEEQTIEVHALSNDTEVYTCTYDLMWIWDKTKDSYTPSTGIAHSEISLSLKEYNSSGTSSTDISDEHYFAPYGSFSTTEDFVIKHLTITNSSAAVETVKKYGVVVTFTLYEDVQAGKLSLRQIGATVKVANVNCG